MACEHADFEAYAEVNRLTDVEGGPVVGYSVDLRVWCTSCGEAAVFRGAPVGVDQARPMMSVDGREMRLPFRLESQDPNTGMGLPGVTARIREGMPGASN